MVEIQEVQLERKRKRELKRSSAKIKTCPRCGIKFIIEWIHQKYCRTCEFDTKLVLIDGEYKWVRDGEILDS